jgi:hypothetical protein
MSYKYLVKVDLGEWVASTWGPLLGYVPEYISLTKGWFGILCKCPEDTNQLLDQHWILGHCSLMLKRWRLTFNPDTEYFHLRHVCVLLPALPLQFWNKDALFAIGNSLGTYMEIEPDLLSSPVRKIGKILVELDVHKGLPKILEIVWCDKRYIQKLNYLGIPFRCSLCHKMSHLRGHCGGMGEEEKISENTTLHRDQEDFEEEEISAWTERTCPGSEPPSSPVSEPTIAGKLLLFCPGFYNSLSLLEKAKLENFPSLIS